MPTSKLSLGLVMPKTKHVAVAALRILVRLLVSAGLALGCGRSPAAPPPSRAPSALPCACDADDDDDEPALPRASSVEYVPIEEWRPSESVQRLESQITARGDAQPSYIDFPKLTRHEPIPEPRVHGGFRIPRAESPRVEGARTESPR